MACSACVHVERPDVPICLVNSQLSHKQCYNLLRDYDDNGMLLPSAKPSVVPVQSLEDIDKNVTFDPDAWSGFKAYLKALRESADGNSPQ